MQVRQPTQIAKTGMHFTFAENQNMGQFRRIQQMLITVLIAPEWCYNTFKLEHWYCASGHAQQPLKDVWTIISEPRVHVLIGDVLPNPLYMRR